MAVDDAGQDLSLLLTAAGISPVIVGYLPATPDEVTMIRTTTGLEDEETHDGVVYEHPRVQVIVRSTTFELAVNIARLARKVLRRSNFAILGTRYLRVHPIGSIGDLGRDDQKPARRLVSFNCQIIKEELP